MPDNEADFVDIPIGEPEPEPRRIVVDLNEAGIPTAATPIGVPMTALPTALRLAAMMIEQKMGVARC